MSGYDSIGATGSSVGSRRAGRDSGRGTVEISFDMGRLNGDAGLRFGTQVHSSSTDNTSVRADFLLAG
jgi:hypothetical protein